MTNCCITSYEAAKRAGFAIGHVRHLLAKRKLKGRIAKITNSKSVWLINSTSFKKYLSTPRKPGPKPKKK